MEAKAKEVIIVGWVLMLVALLANTLLELLFHSIQGHQTEWVRDHFGMQGLSLWMVILPVYMAMPLLSIVLRARWFRGLLVLVSSVALLLTLGHHLHDADEGQRQWFTFVPFVMHHLISAAVLVSAVGWFRCDRHPA